MKKTSSVNLEKSPFAFQKRDVFNGARALLPECPMLGWASFSRATVLGLAPHKHTDCHEICFMVRGSVEWWAQSQVFSVGPHDIFVTQPGEEHGGVDAFMHPCELFWVHIRPRNALLQQLSHLRQRHFKGDATMTHHFRRLLQEHRGAQNALAVATSVETSVEKQTSSTRSLAALRAALNLLVVDTLRFHDAALRAQPSAPPLSPQISVAMQSMIAQLESPRCLSLAAQRASLRGTQFRKRFQDETGFSPQEYLVRARVQEAKTRLRQSAQTVTEIAFGVGFSSSQYFATVFRKLVGMTPQQYRQRTEQSATQSATQRERSNK